MYSKSVFISFCLIVLICNRSNLCADEPDIRPNIVLILADDMGYGDLASHGSKDIVTPNLTELAKSGVDCRRAYVASSVCSPSRAGLITGRDPRRFGYQANLNKSALGYPTRAELQGLPVGEHTLADQLKHAGYATGLFGKWHLGKSKEFHPNNRGFDHFFGVLGGNHNYFPNRENSQLERNGQPESDFDRRYLTDIFTDEAIDWISNWNVGEQPWFAFVSYNAPHTPMQAKSQDLNRFKHIANKKRRTYAAMMFSLDENIGRIRKHLQELGCLENTLIVFLSDNGGATNNGSWNGTLSGAKGCLREGGIRVPMFISWPKQIPSHATCNDVVSSLDLMPTFVAAAKVQPLPLSKPASYEDKRNRKRAVKLFGDYDGINLLPYLSKQQPSIPNRNLFFRLQGQAAIITGYQKLIRLSHRPAQFFKVEQDPGEQHDFSNGSPERLKSMFEKLSEWESVLPTSPLWKSSPYWNGDSAKIYDDFGIKTESDAGK